MVDDVPPIDPDLNKGSGSQNERLEQLEYEKLKEESRSIQLANRENAQRYWLKWIAAGTGVVVIIAMAFVLMHLVHSVFWGPFIFANAAFSVAMVVAPIISITTITVALFVGAFRRFEEKDLETMGSGVAGATNLMRVTKSSFN